MQFKFKSHSVLETQKIAAEVLELVLSKKKGATKQEGCVVFLLNGELGAGKTHFTKGLADVLHVKKIKSPSYIYVNEHDVNSEIFPLVKRLIHIDAWRLNDAETAKLIILPEYFAESNIVVIEWPQKLLDLKVLELKNTIQVSVEIISGTEPEERLLTIESY